jgi:signal transduction histidine kinase
VVCDRNILTLVLRNLLSNAIKFSFEGGKITVNIYARGQILEICITDQGVGMDSATLQSLLSPTLTVSTQGTHNEKGTGLGLALCREYVQKAGGSLTVESTVGKGSIFTVTLPLET